MALALQVGVESLYKNTERKRKGKVVAFDWFSEDLEAQLKCCNLT